MSNQRHPKITVPATSSTTTTDEHVDTMIRQEIVANLLESSLNNGFNLVMGDLRLIN